MNTYIIDYGTSNLGSIYQAIDKLGFNAEIISNPKSLNGVDKIVLPGVGSFSQASFELKSNGWFDEIKEHVLSRKKSILGICLGMQLLASEGSEGATNGCSTAGLDLIPGNVRSVKVGKNLVLPHVGWNSLNWNTNTNPISRGIPDGGDMYYVHSYCFQASDPKHVLANTNYGEDFTSVVGKNKCYGVQFHPEKSQRLGRRLLENFLTLPAC